MNSEIIIAKNINIDKNYNNVLDYTESEMLSLLNSNSHFVNKASDYQFVRPQNSIFVNFPYSQCIQSNYIAFQNKDYSNKWFFAWIDEVIYHSESACELVYTIDAWSTYYDKWEAKSCYVLRHHVNSDNIGENTLPEGLETGEYIIDNYEIFDGLDNMSYIIQCSEWADSDNTPLAMNFGGVYCAGGAYICETMAQVVNILQLFQNNKRSDAVINVYMCPTALISNSNNTLQYSGQNNPNYLSKEINKPKSINGYTPKNNKLLTFPYCYMNVSNNNGSVNSYIYELFNEVKDKPNKCVFNIKGVPTVGASIKCSPFNYKNSNNKDNEDEGLMGGKYPTLSWSEDAYLNWLTSNSVNVGIGVASNLLTIAGGIGLMASGVGAVAGGGAIVSASVSIASQINQVYQHSLAPNTARGNTNGGDINSCSNTNTFIFEQCAIRKEYAEVIDDYFTRYGYKINRITIPNITGRDIWNYIEIGSQETIGTGSVPSKFMEIINNACRKGVTIWHNHENVGNYKLDNNIKR